MTRAAWAFIILTVVGVVPATAQDGPDYDGQVLQTCLERASGKSQRGACIGVAADACAMTEAGQSTIGLGYCFSSEWEDWDQRLNAAYQALLIQQAEVADDNAAFNPNIPNAVDTMREMQRHWIAFRDAACTWEAVQWGGGTGQGPASAECMMRLTAQQTLLLEGTLR